MSRLKLVNRRKLVKTIVSKPPETSDYWEYAVSRAWLDEWTNTDSLESMSTSLERPIQELTMSSVDQENRYLSESIFRMLASWFGVHPKHLLRRRPIDSGYRNLDPLRDPYGGSHVIADKELDRVPIWVGDLNEMLAADKYKNVFEVFAWDTFGHMKEQVVRCLNLGPKSINSVRLWFGIKTVDSVPIFEPIYDMKLPLITKLIELVPEVKNLMVKRQSQYSPKFMPSDKKVAEVRIPLGEALLEVFSDQIPQLSIGLEELGIEEIHGDDQSYDSGNESIVTLSSVKNEWEDVLTTTVHDHAKHIARSSEDVSKQLVTSARQIVGDKLNEIGEIKADYSKWFADLQEREKAVREKENENNEKEMELQNRLAIFKKGLDDFQRQKKKLIDDMNRIEAQNKISESLVSLNIGGILYTTSLSTLTREENSLFAVMFSGQHALKRQPDGTYFIDRDGMNFRYILNYLRVGGEAIHTIPEDERVVREIVREAKHYQLGRLEDMLQSKLEEMAVRTDGRVMASI